LERDLKELTPSELVEEIRRERSLQEERRRTLQELEARIAESKAKLEEERLRRPEERAEARRRRIEELRRILAAWDREIESVRRRIAELQAAVAELERRIGEEEARVRDVTLPVEVRRAALENIRRLVASRRAYEGHITRLRALLEGDPRTGILGMLTFRRLTVAELAAQERWLRAEAAAAERIRLHLENIRVWTEQAERLRAEIAREEERLKAKLKLLPRLHRVKIRLYAVIQGEELDYPRVFQAWYDVDAILGPEARIDWDWWLTSKQIEVAKYEMVREFNWEEWEEAPALIQKSLYDYLPPGEAPELPEEAKAAWLPTPYFDYPIIKRGIAETRLREIMRRLGKAREELTVESVIVGWSSVAPRPTDKPQGLYKERLLVVYRNRIQYDEEVEEWIRYAGWEEDLKRAMEELGLT
jgi:hypothetical protein